MVNENKSNIVLIGMPGVGKSTIGVLLAKRLKKTFIDIDVVIQAGEGKMLNEIISEKGMEDFCKIECGYAQCVDTKEAVIATGGSVVYYSCGMRSLKANGVIVYLQLPLDELSHRLGDLNQRGVVLDPGQTLEDLYQKRTVLYEQWADITVDLSGLDHERCVDAVVKSLGFQE